MVPVALFCLVDGGVAFRAMILVVSMGLVYEGACLAGLTWRRGRDLWRGLILVAWPVVCVLAALRGEWHTAFMAVLPAMIFGPAQWLCVLVSCLGGLSLIWLREGAGTGYWSVLFVICIVVASDSTAYVVGRIVGGPKLAPRISPGKTRSGALGGLAGAGLAGLFVASGSGLEALAGAFSWGMVLGFFAQCGDLVESWIKRRVSVKDSGWLIPGHGGLLDRFDGLLAAAPVAALVSLCAQGRPFWAVTASDLLCSILPPFF